MSDQRVASPYFRLKQCVHEPKSRPRKSKHNRKIHLSGIRGSLAASNADEVTHLSPETGRRSGDGVLVGIDQRALPDQVNLMGLQPLSLLDELPSEEKNGNHNLHGIVLEEELDIKGVERGVSVEDDNEGLQGEGDVGTVGLETAVVWHGGSVDALSLASIVEADEGDGHDQVVDQTTGSHEADQPGENLAGTGADLEEGEEGERHDDAEAVDRNTALGAATQEAGSTALESQRVERSGSTVSVGVTGREDRGEQQGVDDVRKDADAQVLHGNDIGRGLCSAAAGTISKVNFSQSRVVGANNDADGQRSDNEEEAESVVDRLESSLDVDAGSLSLGGNHGDVFGTDNGEASAPESCAKPFEAAQSTQVSVFEKRARLRPVAEAVGIVLGVASDHGDEGEAEEQEDENHLAAGQPEFGLAVHAHGKNIQTTTITQTTFSMRSYFTKGEGEERIPVDVVEAVSTSMARQAQGNVGLLLWAQVLTHRER